MIAIDSFEWAILKIFNKMPKKDVFLVIIVDLITVLLHNLALARRYGFLSSTWKRQKLKVLQEKLNVKVLEKAEKSLFIQMSLF